MLEYPNASGNKTKCNSSKISPGCNLPQTYVLHHSFQQNVTNWRTKRIDQSIMENDAFPRMLGLGALGVGLFGSCLKKKKKNAAK